MATEIYERENSPCYAYGSPQEDMMTSLNKLMVYMGAFAGRDAVEQSNVGHMDPGNPVQTTIFASPIGEKY